MALENGKFKGKGLSLLIDSVEYNVDLSAANFVSEDADNDTTVFAEVGTDANKDWFLDVQAVLDYGNGSLWRAIWENTGDEDVAYIYKPYGNATASTAQPHFTGTLTIPTPPDFGGEADSTFTFESRFELDGKPTMVTTGGGG